jgi:hypothetical protein
VIRSAVSALSEGYNPRTERKRSNDGSTFDYSTVHWRWAMADVHFETGVPVDTYSTTPPQISRFDSSNCIVAVMMDRNFESVINWQHWHVPPLLHLPLPRLCLTLRSMTSQTLLISPLASLLTNTSSYALSRLQPGIPSYWVQGAGDSSSRKGGLSSRLFSSSYGFSCPWSSSLSVCRSSLLQCPSCSDGSIPRCCFLRQCLVEIGQYVVSGLLAYP